MGKSAAAYPWLITRAYDEAAPLAARLERLGTPAAVFPCIERRAVDWAADPAGWSGRPTVFMVTSPFGARCLASHWPRLRGRGKVAAMLPATAAVLESAGIPVAIGAGGGALALARAVLADVRTAPSVIVWLTSAAGIGEPEQRQAASLLAQAGELHRVIAYETHAPRELAAMLAEWHGRPARAAFFSPSACRNFLAARAAASGGPVVTEVACIGRSTLRAWVQSQPSDLPGAVGDANEEAFVARVTGAS